MDDSPITNGHGEKRKSEDAGTTHTRAKRNRYISIACNECKRRKIKCNGQTPCQRCGNLSLECIYAPNCCTTSVKDSEEFQQMRDHIALLQDQVDDLYANLNELRGRTDGFLNGPESIYPADNGRAMAMSMSRTLPPLPSPNRSQKSFPKFHGPTSSTYGFDVARSSLQTMGITQAIPDDGGISRDRSPNASPKPYALPHPNKDPLWMLNQTEAVRLCRVYEEEIGIMYPFFDIDKAIKHIDMLYSFIGAAVRSGFGQPGMPGPDTINDDETTLVKMMLAITLMLEGNGKSDLAERFFDSARPIVNLRIIESTDMKAVHMIIMTATYHFHKDEEGQAWRFIGIAARMCLEMGLHRKDSLVKSFTNEAEYTAAIRTFWVVYALDRRWSFGTGMPFALQDADIDTFLPEPDDAFPYLKHITQYNKIAAKIWYHNVARESGQNAKGGEIGFFDYQVLQWYQQLPDSLKFNGNDLQGENQIPGRGARRLRFLMYLRRNQARISIYRPIMYSATSILDNRQHAQIVVDVAKDTISTITGVNQISDLYRTQQICYNYFLIQALAVIFLGAAHTPAEFCTQSRTEFYAAIDLIRGFSTKSHISKRLWRTIRGLKEMGDKIGVLARCGNPAADHDQDAHSSAAVAMAGLAGHQIDNMPSYSTNSRLQANELAVSPEDGAQMSNELTNLFELAQGYGNFVGTTPGAETFGGYVGPHGEILNGGEGVNAIFGNEQEFSRIMGELL